MKNAIRQHHRVTLLIIVWMLTTGCLNRSPADLLWVPPDATIEVWAPRRAYKDGHAEMAFRIPISDSASKEQLTRALSEHFERNGWTPRGAQWMNPQLATSFSAGWKHIPAGIRLTDAEGRPLVQMVYSWVGEWEDSDGNLISYRMSAVQHQSLDRSFARGGAQYVPARIAKRGSAGWVRRD
jgi:hypothetical protein